MPPDGLAQATGWSGAAGRLTPEWRDGLLRLFAAWALLIGVFLADWIDMARQWWSISTYVHILLVPAIVAWLVWQRAGEISRIVPRSWWPGLALVAFACLVWLLGVFASLATARQLGAVAMLIAAALAMLGPRVCMGLVFPLAYLLFLVPVGDEIVPAMQMVTAAITIALVKASGVPAVIDGVFIDTPAGLFEVAEACSGVKFLVAMIALGALAANVCFVSWRRRALFMAACVAVPVLANGVRAWATIEAAQYFGIEVAAGFDHIVYGWLFFALVIGLVLLGAWRFFDRPAASPVIDADAINSAPWLARLERLRISPVAALALLAAITLGAQGWARAADTLAAPVPTRIDLPPVDGWRRVDHVPGVWWEPRARGAAHRLLGRYADAQGREVDVFVAVYATQREGGEPGGFGEGALVPASAWSWLASGPLIAGGPSERLLANGRVERLARTWYRSGGLTTGSVARLRLATMGDRVAMRVNPAIVLIVSAEERPGKPAVSAIASFLDAMGPIPTWMDQVAGLD